MVLSSSGKIGNNWAWSLVLAIGVMNYIYKFVVAIIMTPVIIYVEKWIERYVGKETAHKMRLSAMGQEVDLQDDHFENIPTAG